MNGATDSPHAARRAGSGVTLVTVTYGERLPLLLQALESAFADGVDRAVVVDNGARVAIGPACRDAFGDRVSVVVHAHNLGSAPGFRAGMARACEDGAEFVMLLDDDNRLEPGCIAALLSAHREAEAADPARPVAVVGFRPDNQTDITAGESRQALHPNAFFGFHLKHAPRKLWSRIRRRWPRVAPRAIPAIGVLDVAPYSGMLFRAHLIDVIGLPDASFVLYADDTDFSYRITRLGGALLVVTAARVSDIEPSWNIKRLHRSSLAAWLLGGSDLSVYYAARNRACFERHRVPHVAWIRWLNRATFLLALRLAASRLSATERYHLFHAAVRDGEARRLGVKPGFELA